MLGWVSLACIYIYVGPLIEYEGIDLDLERLAVIGVAAEAQDIHPPPTTEYG